METRIVLSWLSYLTAENRDQRIDNYVASLKSLATFPENVHIVIVDNSNIVEPLFLRDKYLPRAEVFLAKNRWCDIAVHYVGCEVAFLQKGINYFAYSYDDFVFYDTEFFEPTLEFMKKNSDVSCTRFAEYSVANRDWYDTEHTPKTTNPEAVRHNNTADGSPVVHEGPFEHTGRTFYKNRWRPTSRPTMWHVGAFMGLAGYPRECPTLQQFEQHMYDRSDAKKDWQSAFMDVGACRTFPQATSERINQGLGITTRSPIVNAYEMLAEVKNRENWR